MTKEQVRFQVAVSVIQGIIEGKHGIIGEVVPAAAVDEAFRIADQFTEKWFEKYEGERNGVTESKALSDDEKTRKALIELVYSDVNDLIGGVEKRLCVSYLEKQKEQIPSPLFKVGDKIKLKSEPKYPFREIIDIKNGAYYFDAAVHLPFKEQDKWEAEQRPTNSEKPKDWSEEDEKMLRTIISDGSRGVELDSKQIAWLKARRPQPKVDVDMIAKREYEKGKKDGYWEGYKAAQEAHNNAVAFHYDNPNILKLYPNVVIQSTTDGTYVSQPHWKPSEEQMKALNAVANEGVLLDLFNDLLKLF